jgi:peptide/nickel transport system permease protein
VALEVSVQAPDLGVVDGPSTIAAPAANAVGNWRGAWRRLRRNRAAMVAGAVFVFILFASFPGATLWVHFVAHRGPNVQNLEGVIRSGGHRVPVVSADGTPIGPGFRGQYLLGADANGRDLFVRLLYGGRTSLTVGIASAVLCTLLDLIWSFPVYLLAIAISASLIVGGLDIGPVHISSSSLLIPILVIAVVYVPYIARPIRGEVLGLRQREFVEAAIAHGSGPVRVMRREILPNVAATTLVLFTLIIANNILTEAALSFLGVGVSVLTPSWGNIIQEGYSTMVTAPWQTLAPGIAIMLTAISLNVLGDGLRDALDPHGARRGGGR